MTHISSRSASRAFSPLVLSHPVPCRERPRVFIFTVTKPKFKSIETLRPLNSGTTLNINSQQDHTSTAASARRTSSYHLINCCHWWRKICFSGGGEMRAPPPETVWQKKTTGSDHIMICFMSFLVWKILWAKICTYTSSTCQIEIVLELSLSFVLV